MEEKFKILECTIADAEYSSEEVGSEEVPDDIQEQINMMVGNITLVLKEKQTGGVFSGIINANDIAETAGIEGSLTSKQLVDLAQWLRDSNITIGVPVPDLHGDNLEVIMSKLQNDIVFVEELKEIQKDEYIKSSKPNISKKFSNKFKKG